MVRSGVQPERISLRVNRKGCSALTLASIRLHGADPSPSLSCGPTWPRKIAGKFIDVAIEIWASGFRGPFLSVISAHSLWGTRPALSSYPTTRRPAHLWR